MTEFGEELSQCQEVETSKNVATPRKRKSRRWYGVRRELLIDESPCRLPFRPSPPGCAAEDEKGQRKSSLRRPPLAGVAQAVELLGRERRRACVEAGEPWSG